MCILAPLPPIPSSVEWDQRQWSLRKLFKYFCTEPCPPTSDTASGDNEKDTISMYERTIDQDQQNQETTGKNTTVCGVTFLSLQI